MIKQNYTNHYHKRSPYHYQHHHQHHHHQTHHTIQENQSDMNTSAINHQYSNDTNELNLIAQIGKNNRSSSLPMKIVLKGSSKTNANQWPISCSFSPTNKSSLSNYLSNKRNGNSVPSNKIQKANTSRNGAHTHSTEQLNRLNYLSKQTQISLSERFLDLLWKQDERVNAFVRDSKVKESNDECKYSNVASTSNKTATNVSDTTNKESKKMFASQSSSRLDLLASDRNNNDLKMRQTRSLDMEDTNAKYYSFASMIVSQVKQKALERVRVEATNQMTSANDESSIKNEPLASSLNPDDLQVAEPPIIGTSERLNTMFSNYEAKAESPTPIEPLTETASEPACECSPQPVSDVTVSEQINELSSKPNEDADAVTTSQVTFTITDETESESESGELKQEQEKDENRDSFLTDSIKTDDNTTLGTSNVSDADEASMTVSKQDDEYQSTLAVPTVGDDDSLYSFSFEDDIMKEIMPKKSCLVLKSKLFVDINNESIEDTTTTSANATSSPLFTSHSSPGSLGAGSASLSFTNLSSLSPPVSPSQLTSSSQPTLHQSKTATAALASLVDTNSSSDNQQQQQQHVQKKRVLFADTCGKDLFSVRTMSEPSNCPPKLTSKIVQYFLNREFNSSSSNLNETGSLGFHNNSGTGLNKFMQSTANNFLTTHSRNYDYGISAMNYTNDVNQLSGSIAVYSLNFAQPAGDYFKFRKNLDENNVSLENVLLNQFQINGTIKVKNINFHKRVFVRCSFNNWKTFEDYPAQYVPTNDYSATGDHHSSESSLATFYSSNHTNYQPARHKEYDTFRFEFQLPKTVDAYRRQLMERDSYVYNYSSTNSAYDNSKTGSIQFCVCYRAGVDHEMREFWDSNGGSNYEIMQCVIDIECLKPSSQKNQLRLQQQQYQQQIKFNSINNQINKSAAALAAMSASLASANANKSNYFRFDEKDGSPKSSRKAFSTSRLSVYGSPNSPILPDNQNTGVYY